MEKNTVGIKLIARSSGLGHGLFLMQNMHDFERMIILEILEIMNFRSPLLMPLSMQNLRNESEQFPNMPRELMERLIKIICL